MSLILALSLVAGFLVGILVVWPVLAPILLAVGLVIFIYFRYTRAGAHKKFGASKWKKR